MKSHISPLLYFLLLLKASLFSTGGIGNLPSIRSDFNARGWADQHDYLQALTVGQVSPGPTGLWVVAFGYLSYGMRGALFAIAAIILPPLLVLLIRRAYARMQGFAAVEGFVHGLGLAAIGAFACVMVQLLFAMGATPRALIVVVCAFGLATFRRMPTIAILALAAAAGMLR
jgi:chromate transporter